MNTQNLAQALQAHLQEHAAQEAERQKQEVVDVAIKIATATYTSAKAYANVIIIAGYAAFLAMWSYVRADVPKEATLWALLLMMASATVFVLFELYKMIWSGIVVSRIVGAANRSPDPVVRLQELDKLQQREVKAFVAIWVAVLAFTVPAGICAVGILAWNVSILALRTSGYII